MDMHGLFDLRGKVALLTGATRGIGLAMAEAMGLSGARVVISGNEAEECGQAASELRALGIDAVGIVCDVGCREQVEHLYRETLDRHGRVDILVCNAGVAPAPGALLQASDADWERCMRINLQSQLWLTGLAISGMAERRDGVVILTSSLAGVRGNKGLGLYGLAKAGVAQLARNLAVEWGPANVRVNAISPGVIRTRFAAPMLDDPQVMARRLALTPLRRAGEPHEIAGVAVMLAAKAGAFITGQNLIVDGGTTISDGN